MAEGPIIHDLDILRPQPEYVILAGKKIDISFIPSGIAIDITQLQSELADLTDTPEKLDSIKAGGTGASKTFGIAAEICAKITEAQHPEMTKEWLLKNTDVIQIKALMDHISRTVFKSLEASGDDELKKQQTAGVKSNP